MENGKGEKKSPTGAQVAEDMRMGDFASNTLFIDQVRDALWHVLTGR